MTAEGWREVERLLHEALQLVPAKRVSFVSAISDPNVRAEVESLLAADSTGQGEARLLGIIGEAALEVGGERRLGEEIGHYWITEIIGAGGMGIVYRAEDQRLGRPVALKFLKSGRALAASPDRLRREARAASALNHANICTVYDVGEHHGAHYLVMEFVEGETLTETIQKGALKLDALLRVSVQVADAVATGHQRGIIHRDLKPANIKLRPDGAVKILDFGLAKLSGGPGVIQADAESTITKAGLVIGTAAYMSPEQAEGKPLDSRTDIFSFGAVLYEMATGCRAFSGDSQAGTIAAVLTAEPTAPSKLNSAVPLELDRIILSCLQKDPAKRPRHMQDVRQSLEKLKEGSASGALARSNILRRRWLWAAVVMLVAIAAAITCLSLIRNREEPLTERLDPLTTFAGSENYASFSPDGTEVAFSWNGEKKDNWDVYVKLISGATSLRLTMDGADDLFPVWSPAGRQIAFLRSGKRPGIYVTSPLGGPEQKLVDFDAAEGAPAWAPNEGFLVAAKAYREDARSPGAGELFLIPLHGGAPRSILSPPSGRWYQYPAFDLAGRSLVFAACEGPAYGRYCDIMRVSLDSQLLPAGAPKKVIRVSATVSGLTWNADGRSVIYSAGNLATGLYLWRADPSGKGEPQRLEIASPGALYPTVARIGRRLAFTRWKDDQDVWRLELGRTPQPCLVSSMLDASASFSRDGRRIAFASGRGIDRIAIWVSNADGSGLVQLTRGPENYHGSPRWSPDGRWVAFDARDKDGRWNVKVIESSGGETRQLTNGPFTSGGPRWSQDGKWIYFASDRTGRFETWRVPSASGSVEQMTTAGGGIASESTDAKTLYYLKTSDPRGGPLFARPLDGRVEQQVLPRVVGRAFEVLQEGIYYIDSIGPGKQKIRLYDFTTRSNRLISPIDEELGIGFAVSPDRKTFLFTRMSTPGSDLMLIEDFR